MDLSIIIVNYNSKNFIDQCIESILRFSKGVNYEIVVVDNASQDGSVELLKEKYPTVRLIANNENLYFIKANNQALKEVKSRYVLLLNPDTILIENSFKKMIQFMETYPEAGACTPKLLNPNGNLQRTCMRFPSISYGILELLLINRLFPNNPINRQIQYADWDRSFNREVEVGAGACLLLRREVLNRVGLLDESYIMYNEEVDWCYRIRKTGYKIFYLAETSIIHYIGGSTIKSHKLRKIYQESFLHVYKKYYSYPIYLFLKGIAIIPNFIVFLTRESLHLKTFK